MKVFSSPCLLFLSHEWYWDGLDAPPLTQTYQIRLKEINPLSCWVTINSFNFQPLNWWLIYNQHALCTLADKTYLLWDQLALGSFSLPGAAAEGGCALAVPAPVGWHWSAGCSEYRWHPAAKANNEICRRANLLNLKKQKQKLFASFLQELQSYRIKWVNTQILTITFYRD